MTSRTRILVVDDDPVSRQLYGDGLEQAGHQVRAASNAAQASEALARDSFDVVVTDLILPDQDGLAVLAEAKRRDPGIEVIVITAVDRVDPAVRAIKSGAADYLVKPVPPESLTLSVSRCVATRQLLRENALLRQHLALVETGQRLATTLDRAHLFPLAAQSFGQALQASGVLLFTCGTDGQLSLAGRDGFSDEDAGRIATAALSLLQGMGGGASELTVEGETFRLLHSDSPEARSVCLLRGATQDVIAWTNANFLARHFTLALQNLNRLSAAEDLIYVDDLTKLHNLRSLHEALDREISRSRHGGNPFSVLFMDLDHFKKVNDTHGHLVGSKLLGEMGTLLKTCVRDIDVAGRYGGDEYVIILPNTDARGAMKVGERIRKTVETHQFLTRDGLAIQVTACIGVASFPEHARDKQHILECADRAMYRGKETTRNVVYVATPSGIEVCGA